MKKTKTLLCVSAMIISGLSFAACSVGKKDSSSSLATSNTSAPDSTVSSATTSAPATSSEDRTFDPKNYANGAKSYVASSYEERTKILGLLESYAVKHNLTGMTMYENGSYVMYDPAVVKGTTTYIPGYGFGVVSEGYIGQDMANEPKTEWKRYYHSYEAEDPKTINYQNDKGSVVGDLIGFVSGSYFTTQMNEFKDGYACVSQLANDQRPVALNADAHGLATKYRLEVKVGDELQYRTGSTKLSQFNGRKVQLEDYVTPYKIYYTSAYGMARGSENLKGSGSIKGSSTYYNKSTTGFNAEAWNNMGIKAVEEGGKSYLEFTFNNPCNQFYAMYYLSNSMFAPVPEEFITTIGGGDFTKGVAAWGNYTNSGYTPVDTLLSTGPYYIENWESDVQIVFGKNNFYKCQDDDRYKMAGVHFKILKAATTDRHAVINEFLAGNLHASGIPSDMLDTYKNDERTTQTVGDSTFKLNFNTCTQDRWIELFGEEGTIAKTAEADYWECEPAMANDSFVAGLGFAFNREQFAEKYGSTPSANYFGSGYLSNQEEGIMYNNTQAHKDAVEILQAGTKYGYNLEYSKASFKKACEELIASGEYSEGDTIELEVAWQTPSDETQFHADVKKYWEDAFNSCGGGLTLNVKFWAGASWSDVYYEKMMVGQFDVGFGSISGNTLNPLNFFEVLKSDNSSGFTLNWGPDTSEVSEDLYYDGCYWSFDALWQAADTGAYLDKGYVTPIYNLTEPYLTAKNFTLKADKSATVTIGIEFADVENASANVTGVAIFGAFNSGGAVVSEEDELSFTLSEDRTKIIVEIPAEIVAKYQDVFVYGGYYYNFSFDIYVTSTICGVDSESVSSAMMLSPDDSFPKLS